jgi:hypothetical protein
MIDMRYIVAGLQVAERFQRQRFVFIVCLLDLVFMIALEDLVVGITNQFQFFINKSFVDAGGNRNELYFRVQVGKNAVEPFQLACLFGKNINGIPAASCAFRSLISRSNWRLKAGCGLVLNSISEFANCGL